MKIFSILRLLHSLSIVVGLCRVDRHFDLTKLDFAPHTLETLTCAQFIFSIFSMNYETLSHAHTKKKKQRYHNPLNNL